MKNQRAKRMIAILLTVATLLSLAACGSKPDQNAENSAAPTGSAPVGTENEPAFSVSADDETIYMNNFGEFYDAYQLAMEAETVSERHALLAVAEAKALEASGGAPMYGPVAGYIMTRLLHASGGYAPWRGTRTDYSQYVITNEIITAEDNAYIKTLWRDLMGTGTYIEKAKEYLTSKGYTFNDTMTDTFVDNATTWNIFTASTSNDGNLIAPTYDYLYAYDAEGQLVPHLATGYEISDDGLTYTILSGKG